MGGCRSTPSRIDAASQQLTVLQWSHRIWLSGAVSAPIIPPVSISSLRSPAVFAALALIALATLTPGSGPGGWGVGFPDPADLLVNIALFVPLGMAVRAGARRADHGRPLQVALLTALVVSTVIELAQLILVPRRDSSPWDVAANVAGAALGASISARLVVLPLIPAWLASAWLLSPTPPPTPVWWGQWAHQFGSPAPFSGTIRAVAFNGESAPDQSLGATITALMKAGYRTPRSVLAVHLSPPTRPSPGRVQVAGIADGTGGEVVGLWQSEWDLELRWHARGTRWGLRHPAVRAPGLLFLDPRLETSVDARLYSRDVTIVVADGPHEMRHQVLLGPWQGWRLFWPLEPPGPGLSRLLSLLWTVGCLGVPVAVWIGWARKR